MITAIRKYFIPSILPKKRTRLLIIAIILSASILGASLSLLLGISNSANDFLTPAQDVVVISNPKATTPFTSSVPLSMIETIKQVKGVVAVSPEILLLGTFNKYSLMGRGVIEPNFTRFNQIRMISGSLPEINDTVGVALGYKLADFLGLQVGDSFEFYSALKNYGYEFIVKGIFKSGTYLDDEFLVSLVSAIPLSNVGPNHVTHIQVKINTNIISKQDFKKKVFSVYSLNIALYPLNGSKNTDNIIIKIRDSSNQVLISKTVKANETIQFKLLFGTYNVSFGAEKNLQDSVKTTKILLSENTNLSVAVGLYLRRLHFQLKAGNEFVTTGKVTFYSFYDSMKRLELDLPNNSILIPEGKYYLKYTKNDLTLWSEIRVKGINPNITVNLETVNPPVNLVSPINKANYSTSKIPLIISSGPSNIYYELDNSTIEKYSQPIILTLQNGIHLISIYYNDTITNKLELIYKASFNVNTSLPIIKINNAFLSKDNNYYFIYLAGNQSISLKGFLTVPLSDFAVSLNDYLLNSITNSLGFDSGFQKFRPGIYTLKVNGTFYNSTIFQKIVFLEINNKPFSLQGLGNTDSILPVINGTFVQGFLPNNLIENVYLNSTISKWNSSGFWVPDNKTGLLDVKIKFLNGTLSKVGSLKVLSKEEFKPVIFDLNGNIIGSVQSPLNYSLPEIIMLKAPFYNFTMWYFSTDNKTWETFDGLLLLNGINSSSKIIYLKYLCLSGFSPIYKLNITTNETEKTNQILALEFVSNGLLLKNVIADSNNNNSLFVANKNFVIPITITNNVSSQLVRTSIFENITISSINFKITLNFTKILGFNPFNLDSSLNQTRIVLPNTPLSISSPTQFPSQRFFYKKEFSDNLILHKHALKINSTFIGKLYFPGNSTVLKWCGEYSSLSVLEDGLPEDIKIQITNDTAHISGLSVKTQISLVILSQSREFMVKKIILTPFSRNVTLKINIYDRVTHNSVNSNITLIHEDDQTSISFKNINSLELQLRKGPLLIKVWAGDYSTSMEVVLLEDTLLPIDVGKAILTITVLNPNTWENVSGYYLTIRKLGFSDIITRKYVSGKQSIVYLNPGEYFVDVQWYLRTGSQRIIVKSNHQTIVSLDPLLSNVTVKLNGLNNFDFDALLIHVKSGKVFKPFLINEDSKTIVFINVYQGDLKLVLQGTNYNQNFFFSVNEKNVALSVEIKKTAIILNTKDILKLVDSLNYSLLDSDQYLNSFISGPLELVKTVFFAEVFLVVIVILANVISVMRGIISESKNEIFVMESMGANNIQIFIGVMKYSFTWGILASFIGTLLGELISWFLVNLNSIRVFSHSFKPVIGINILIANIAIILILYAVGYFIAFKEEIRK